MWIIRLLDLRSLDVFWKAEGYRVGMIPQPDWRKKESIQVFGEPRWVFSLQQETWIPW
mgnify:CR=1 FL=1